MISKIIYREEMKCLPNHFSELFAFEEIISFGDTYNTLKYIRIILLYMQYNAGLILLSRKRLSTLLLFLKVTHLVGKFKEGWIKYATKLQN